MSILSRAGESRNAEAMRTMHIQQIEQEGLLFHNGSYVDVLMARLHTHL